MPITKLAALRVVLMAGNTPVAEIVDDELWGRLHRRAQAQDAQVRLEAMTVRGALSLEEGKVVAKVLATVAEAYGFSSDVLIGPGRHVQMARARAVAMLILRENTSMTFETIGVYFNRHHTTVMSCINSIRASEEMPLSLVRSIVDDLRLTPLQ